MSLDMHRHDAFWEWRRENYQRLTWEFYQEWENTMGGPGYTIAQREVYYERETEWLVETFRRENPEPQ